MILTRPLDLGNAPVYLCVPVSQPGTQAVSWFLTGEGGWGEGHRKGKRWAILGALIICLSLYRYTFLSLFFFVSLSVSLCLRFFFYG